MRSAIPLQSAVELQARLAAERAGTAFILFRDGDGVQRILDLSAIETAVGVGRSPDQQIALAWDPEVSRVHARLERVGQTWTVVDDGLSRNGTLVNGTRLGGRRRLSDGDVVRCGSVNLEFRDPHR